MSVENVSNLLQDHQAPDDNLEKFLSPMREYAPQPGTSIKKDVLP